MGLIEDGLTKCHFTEEWAGRENEQEIGKLLMTGGVESHYHQQPEEARERMSSLSPGRAKQ